MNTKSFKELKFIPKALRTCRQPLPLVQWCHNSQELHDEEKEKNRKQNAGGGSSLRILKSAGVNEGSGIKDRKTRKE